jgi:hypothetical protein
MAYTYEDVNPTLIANTTMKKRLRDGVPTTYTINANEGYILHDKGFDMPIFDEDGNETGEVTLGFRPPESTASVPVSYDFTANPREFYAILETELPEGAEIFGNGNDHEVM